MNKLYTKNTWVDEALAGAVRYNTLTDVGVPIDSNIQIELQTAVVAAGSPVSSTRMNNIEDGIDALDNRVILEDAKIVAATAVLTTTGTSTAYLLTTLAGLALTTGEMFHVVFHLAADASPTLNRDGKGAYYLKYRDSTGAKVNCGATTIFANMQSDIVFDGSDYVVLDILPLNIQSAAPVLIQRIVGTATADEFNFASIPVLYKKLKLRGILKQTFTGGAYPASNITCRLNNDSGSNYYSINPNTGEWYAADTTIKLPPVIGSWAADAGLVNVFDLEIIEYASSSMFKWVQSRAISANTAGNPTGSDNNYLTLWRILNTVNRVQVFGTFTTASYLELYGMSL